MPSSGFTARLGSEPKTLRTSSETLGARVWPPDQQDLVDLVRLQPRVRQAAPAGLDRALQQVVGERLVLLAREHGVEVLGSGGVGGDEGQHDLSLLRRGQLALGLLGRFLEPLQRHAVLVQVDAGVAQELLDQPVDDALVEVLAAQERVAAGGAHLEEPLRHLQDRDVEGAAAQVVDRDELPARVLEAVGERRRRRLVDDAQDLQARDEAGVLRGLALRVVEVGGHGDDRLVHRLAQVVLGGGLQLLQHEGRDLRRRIDLVLDLDVNVAVGRLGEAVGHEAPRLLDLGRVELAADQALHREHRVLGVGEGLALRDLADQPLTLGREADDRRRRAGAFLVGDDLGSAALHHRHAGVGGAQVDSDDFTQSRPRRLGSRVSPRILEAHAGPSVPSRRAKCPRRPRPPGPP